MCPEAQGQKLGSKRSGVSKNFLRYSAGASIEQSISGEGGTRKDLSHNGNETGK